MSRAPLTGRLTRVLALGLAIGSLGLAAGCGGDDDEEASTTSTDTETTETGTTSETGAELDRFGYPVNAHIQANLGSVPEGIELDAREGTPPPSLDEEGLAEAAVDASCDLELDLEDEGNQHFDDDETDVDYQTNPPTSGDHYAANEAGSGALADGAYAETPPLTRAVHGLEHGRVQIQYSSDLPEEDQLALKGLFDDDPAGVMLFPNDEMPYEVAITAWTQLMGCDAYDGDATLQAIASFRDEFRGNGPEPVPIEL